MEEVFRKVSHHAILSEVQELQEEHYRLIQICATTVPEGYEILYTFGKGYDEVQVKIHTDPGEHVQSISRLFPSAWLYENEIHDLHGIEIDGITLDFRGGLYRTSVKAPFSFEMMNKTTTTETQGGK